VIQIVHLPLHIVLTCKENIEFLCIFPEYDYEDRIHRARFRGLETDRDQISRRLNENRIRAQGEAGTDELLHQPTAHRPIEVREQNMRVR
jgi:hypothetical protein